MTFRPVKTIFITSGIVALFILLVGLSREVSFTNSIIRALTAGGIFGIITFALANIVRLLAFDNDKNTFAEEKKSKFDFRIDDNGVSSLENNQEVQNQEKDKNSNDNFESLDIKQIDPQVNKIINENPERMAEIVRKMGLDE